MGNAAAKAQKQQKKFGFQHPWAAPCYSVQAFPYNPPAFGPPGY
jgi:hypothetical protein